MTDYIKGETLFDGSDFVFTKGSDGNIVGGGYKIKSLFLQEGIPPMTTYNSDNGDNNNQDGGKVSSPFENLAVPAGIFYINMRMPKNEFEKSSDHYKPHTMVSDEMIDKLYSLVEVDNKRKRKTRKNVVKPDKTKTRRHK